MNRVPVGQPADLGDLAGLKAGAGFVMLDGSARFDGDKAYKDSKLCKSCYNQTHAIELKDKKTHQSN